MDTWPGGVTVPLERHNKFDGNEIMVRRHYREDFIRLAVDVAYNWGPLERQLLPTEARRLGAALVALAGAIEQGQP